MKDPYVSTFDSLIKVSVLQPILVVLLCVGGAIQAQPMLTLQDAIAIALENNYDIQLSKNDSAVLGLDYSYRNVVFFPRINGNVGTSWTNNNQKQEFSTGADKEGNVATNNVNASVTLNWTLFDGLKMFATRKKAEEYVQLGQLGIKNQVVNTVAEVINTYYTIVRQKQQLKAIDEQMSISQTRVDLSQRRLDIGLGTRPEYLQSQVDLNAQKAARIAQESYIEQLKESLNQQINRTSPDAQNGMSTEYDVSDSIPIQINLSLEDIQRNFDETNPLLQVTQKNMDIAQLSFKEVKAERYPTVQFNSAYNFNKTNNDIALNPALPLFNRNRGLNYGFTATIPILNYRTTHRRMQQAMLNIEYQSLLYNSQRSHLRLNVINAYKDFEMQKRALELEEDNILLARENVSIILETYRLGSATFIQLREAEKSLEDAYNRLIAARYNTKLAETELLRLKGELVR